MIDINLIGMGTKEIAKDERITRVKKIREKSAFFFQKIMFSHLKLYGFFKMNIDVA